MSDLREDLPFRCVGPSDKQRSIRCSIGSWILWSTCGIGGRSWATFSMQLSYAGMSVTIQLPPDIEADLIPQAQAKGLDLAQYVEHLLHEQVPPPAGTALSTARGGLLASPCIYTSEHRGVLECWHDHCE